MELLISKEYPKDFAKFIVRTIQEDLKDKIKHTNFSTIPVWLKLLYDFEDVISCEDMLLFSLKHLEIISLDNFYKITFNNIVKYKGTNIKIITLIKSITYGNFDFKGRRIILDEFDYIKNNIKLLYNSYELLGEI